MRVVDISVLSGLAKEAGAAVAVDNTFLSPAIQKPISLGADYVVHSTTKYLNGHSEVIGGAVVAADPREVQALRHWANVVGSTGVPFASWLLLRGLRTLFAHMQLQQRHAMAMAAWLDTAQADSKLPYPGLPAQPEGGTAACRERLCTNVQ